MLAPTVLCVVYSFTSLFAATLLFFIQSFCDSGTCIYNQCDVHSGNILFIFHFLPDHSCIYTQKLIIIHNTNNFWSGAIFSYKLRYIVGFGLVEMAISTNPKPTVYLNLYEVPLHDGCSLFIYPTKAACTCILTVLISTVNSDNVGGRT